MKNPDTNVVNWTMGQDGFTAATTTWTGIYMRALNGENTRRAIHVLSVFNHNFDLRSIVSCLVSGLDRLRTPHLVYDHLKSDWVSTMSVLTLIIGDNKGVCIHARKKVSSTRMMWCSYGCVWRRFLLLHCRTLFAFCNVWREVVWGLSVPKNYYTHSISTNYTFWCWNCFTWWHETLTCVTLVLQIFVTCAWLLTHGPCLIVGASCTTTTLCAVRRIYVMGQVHFHVGFHHSKL